MEEKKKKKGVFKKIWVREKRKNIREVTLKIYIIIKEI